MKTITTSIQHSEQTIQLLCKTQYNTFHFRRKALQCLAGLALLLSGLYASLGGAWGPIAAFAGCWLLISLDMPARSYAKRALSQLDGHFPLGRYEFGEDDFTFIGESATDTIPYGKIIRLVEDSNYGYLFLSELTTFMVDKNALADSVDAWRELLSKQTGLPWTRTNRLLTYSLRSFRKNRARQKK